MTVAAIDIGTNSVRLLIVDAGGRELAREMQITRLGQSVDVTGELHPDAITRTLAVLEGYREAIVRHGATKLRATATSAARDARNSALFFDRAEAVLGQRPELLPGEEEAELSFRGATSGLGRFPGPYLVIDIGGGSTEFVLGETGPEQLISTNMGCVRMVERHFRSDPPSAAEVAACFADVRALLEPVRRTIDVARARTAVGLAGTITTLACLDAGLTVYDPSRTHHSRLTREAVERLFVRLGDVDVATRRTLLAEPKRAEVILGGAAILLTLMRELDLPALIVSEADILDGLAASLLDC